MGYKIFIDGEYGTTGLEIKKRLSGLKEIDLMSLPENKKKIQVERLDAYRKSDLVFQCLPDAESLDIIPKADPDTKIIDASSAHRINENWTYGLPELSANQKEKIRNSKRVSNPGCHATGFILLIKPLINNSLLDDDAMIDAFSVTGYSGGGKSMITEYENSDRRAVLNAPGQYGLTQMHKHLPEMKKYAGLKQNPLFVPIVSDYYRGMLVSIPLHTAVLKKKIGIEDIKEMYKNTYKDCALISVKSESDVSDNGFVYANKFMNRDDAEIIICGNNEKMTLMARFDNLGKGASGAAIQNMNLMLGLPEYQGLDV